MGLFETFTSLQVQKKMLEETRLVTYKRSQKTQNWKTWKTEYDMAALYGNQRGEIIDIWLN